MARLRREASRLTAGTLAGDYWHRQLTRACTVWPHAEPQREIATPFCSRIPTLIFSGAYDPDARQRAAA